MALNARIISFDQIINEDLISIESSEDVIIRLEAENKYLKEELRNEQKLRYETEMKLNALEEKADKKTQASRKRRSKIEMEAATTPEYSEFKSDGKRKARPADSIRSYNDFTAIQNYFLSKNKIRDWTLWTIGVALGLRISDLLKLKVKSLLNPDHSFRNRLFVQEQKTGKLNDCLITEAVIDAATRYFDSIKWHFKMDDYLFESRKTKSKLCEEHGWKIVSDAGKALNLPFNVGSHTMRKSFANIAACVDNSSIDMNSVAKIQGLLNHSDQKCTMRYLGTFHDMYDRARVAVSDFILGRTQINELIVGTAYTLDDLMSKLDSLEEMFENNGGMTPT